MSIFGFSLAVLRRSVVGFALAVAATAFFFVGTFSGCDKSARNGGATADPDSGSADSAADSNSNSEPAAKVGVYTVKTETVPLIRELPGRTAASNVAEVRPQINGVVLKRLFNEGADVEEGQALYEIDSRVYAARVAKEQANVDNTEALKNRAEHLKDKDAGSVEEYENALYGWEKAKAELQLAQLDLDYCKITAPISGRVGLSTITVGALVTNGQAEALTTIQQLDPIYVDLNPSVPLLIETRNSVGENDEKRPFLVDAKVEIVLDGGLKYPYPGVVKRFSNKIQEDVGTLTVRAEFPNEKEALLPGMFVRAFVQEGVRKDGKLIPQEAIFRTPKGVPYVWVVQEDSTVSQRAIASERTLGNRALVDSGLEAGERVVVVGTQFISEGARVDASEDDTIPRTTSFEQLGDVARPEQNLNAPNSSDDRSGQNDQNGQNVQNNQNDQDVRNVQK